MITLVQNDWEIAECFKCMKQLHTGLAADSFVLLVRELINDGYQIACLRDNGQVVCVAGFRISQNLFLGKHLYVDDLSTLEEAQSQGYGSIMINWLRKLAEAEGCKAINLDAEVQDHRAHKFYFNQQMNIICYHFFEQIA